MAHFNIIAFLLSGVIYFVIGYFWYSNKLFAKTWIKETGVKMGKNAKPPIVPMVGQLITIFLFTLGIYMIVMLGNFSDFKGAITVSMSVIGFFVIPANSGNLLFTGKTKLFLIDAGYQAVGATVITFILVFWK